MPRVSTVTLLLHGAGSCPETAYDLLAPVIAEGSSGVALDARGGGETVTRLLAQAVDSYERDGHQVVRVAGISLGAHAAGLWSAQTQHPAELVLVMPAWTGRADDVAAATVVAAGEVYRLGSHAVLDRLHADPRTRDDWVLEELERGWSTYDDPALVAVLRAAGTSRAPSTDQLAQLAVPAAVVALADDPMHPVRVAREWVDALPHAALRVVPRTVPADDRGALGRAGAEALEGLSGSR
jgi:pimeloyl-ACP methyl ester carboxylesterase